WTDATWNPVVGCSKVSPGCDNCYAIGQAERIVRMGGKGGTKYEGTVEPGSGEWTGTVKCVPEALDQPLRWKKPRLIFVNSMSDLFHPDVPLDFICEVWSVMANAPQHVFQILTKRPQRMQKIVDAIAWTGGTNGDPWEAYLWPGPWRSEDDEVTYDMLDGGGEVPLANVWLGTSIESNSFAWRADYLRKTPAAVRWISAEPLVGPLDDLDLTSIDWLVVGGESGPNARPMHPDWALDLLRLARCVYCDGEGERFNDKSWSPEWVGQEPTHDNYGYSWCLSCDSIEDPTAFLFKQWGNWAPIGPLYDAWRYRNAEHCQIADDARTEAACLMAELGDHRVIQLERNGIPSDGYQPADDRTWLMVRNGTKKASGRELDGRTWDEYPLDARDREIADSGEGSA
ncbi:MAG: DUF5131 family protein, partial [Solirubrobacterales bacterium]